VKLSRRTLLRTGAAALATPATLSLPKLTDSARADEPAWRHGMSLFGDVKYPAGFPHFEYVNPSAPKAGVVRLTAFGTFDNFNVVVSGVKGTLATGITLIYDTLMSHALDEVSTQYGLVAETASYPADFSSVTYRLNPKARWHDGKPVTAEDVIFSLDALKRNSPMYAAYYSHVVKAEKTGERDITFTFDGPGNRELPQIVGELYVMPKHWWEGTDAQGRKRDIAVTTLEPPLGGGAYRVKDFAAGRTIVYERVKDYWARDLNVGVGTNNFDELRYEYFRDSTVALEAFKADTLDWRNENSAKNWATAYDFPAVKEKRVLIEQFAERERGNMQAFVMNTRRDRFKDPRVRLAMNYAFDFEEMNKQIFFNQYQRVKSYFDGTELACSGLPQGQELAILEDVRSKLPSYAMASGGDTAAPPSDSIPPEVFTKPYANPVGGTPENVRANLREALRLLKEAGYEVRNQKLVNVKSGEPFAIELLTEDPTFERIGLFYTPSLQRLGIAASVRTVDPSQYENRLRSFDYDMIIGSWAESLSPGNEQRSYWGSKAADQPGSRNLVGIKNPAIDALTDRVVFAKDRDELVAATQALDRVLLWNHYLVPQWTYPFQRTARWDRFGHPETLPKYAAAAFPTIWWWDAERAAKTGTR
jgi:microcin C transport system substrate-binding protein